MAALERPKGITVLISDRKERKSKSFVVYNTTIEELEKKIRKTIATGV